MRIRVFYAGQLFHEFPDKYEWSAASRYLSHLPEIYNGAYLNAKGERWYRADLTPVLDADVPKELKLLQVLLN